MDIQIGAHGKFFHLELTIHNMSLYLLRSVKAAFKTGTLTMNATCCSLKCSVRTSLNWPLVSGLQIFVARSSHTCIGILHSIEPVVASIENFVLIPPTSRDEYLPARDSSSHRISSESR